jgi:hypothetical protein
MFILIHLVTKKKEPLAVPIKKVASLFLFSGLIMPFRRLYEVEVHSLPPREVSLISID